MDIGTLFSDPLGIALLALVGVLGGFAVFGNQQFKVHEREWFAKVAEVLTKMGLTLVPKFFHCLAVGDLPGALSTGKAIYHALTDPVAFLNEMESVATNYLSLARKDPARLGRLKKIAQDILADADPSQVAADFKDALAQSPLKDIPAPPDPLADVKGLISKIVAGAKNPNIAASVAQLPDALGHLAGLLDAGHALGAASTPLPLQSANALAPDPVPAAATLPVLPPGHSMTISGPPITDATKAVAA